MMKKVKQKKSIGPVKSRKIVFSKKKAVLLREFLLKVIIDETIN